MEDKTIEEIIIKEATKKRLTPDEKIKLTTWLNQSPGNKKVYAQMVLLLLSPDGDKMETLQEDVWSGLKNKTTDKSSSATQQFHMNTVYKIAASFLLVVSIVFAIYKLSVDKSEVNNRLAEQKPIERVSLPGQKITTVLPDGTLVKLNSDSKLIITSDFSSNDRKVHLTGEAFFEVTRDETRPFVITTDFMEIEVLGTSFNVSAYENNLSRSVAVKSGKVLVSKNSNGSSVELIAQEMSLLSGQGQLKKHRIINPLLAFGWVDQMIVFENESVEEVLTTISRWFGVEIVINDAISNNKLYTATYENPSLKEVLESMSYVYNFKYSIHEKKVIIN